ncbi:TPA: hypothetical protein MYN70_006017, partial [Klebsiella pneumoniae]|nr:hypothetical protein [Klebsiella pneumoniae]
MNPSTLIGIVASVLLFAVILFFTAENPALFVDLPSLAVVLVGTLAATFISYPLSEVVRIFGLIGTVLRNERLYTQQDMDELINISRLWMMGDIRAVEEALEKVANP